MTRFFNPLHSTISARAQAYRKIASPAQPQGLMPSQRQRRSALRPLLRFMLLVLTHQSVAMVTVATGNTTPFNAATTAVGALLLPQAAQAQTVTRTVSLQKEIFTVQEGGTELEYIEIYFNVEPTDRVTVNARIPEGLDFRGASDDARGRFIEKTYKVDVHGWRSDVSFLGLPFDAEQNDKIDGDRTVTMTLNFSGGGYDNMTKNVTIKIIDDDRPAGVWLSTKDVGVKKEKTTTYTVKLDAKPTASVTITPNSNDNAIAKVSSSALTFTTSNWYNPQTVTVKGISAGERTTVSHAVSGANSNYSRINADNVTVTVEGSLPKVIVSPNRLTVREEKTDPYKVRLATKPTGTGTVTVTLRSSDERIAV